MFFLFVLITISIISYLLTLPLFAGVFRERTWSPALTGSHARETLISRNHLFLPHDLPPTKKSSTIKSRPTFCDQYFWFAQRFITIFNCCYHTSNHLSMCHKPISLSPINCQSVDNCCIIINTLINLQMPKRMLSPNAPAAKWLFNFSALWLYCLEHSVFIVIALL
jgi:hypothetical protein